MTRNLPGYKGDSVRATQEHFVHCHRDGKPFETNGRDYLKTFGVVEAAYESAAQCRLVPVHADGSFGPSFGRSFVQ